ncbi:MAG: cell division protein [Bacteriophage sp.]|nr:MAG: cell division protein [Bacteriophage sp.]
MTKDKLKDDIIRTICCLNSDISIEGRELLIKLLNSIVDYTNNTELEQELAQLQQKYNELVTNINEVEKLANDTKTKYNSLYSDISNNLKPKVDNIDKRVAALENSSQS